MKAPEDGVHDEGVGAVQTTLQAEMMPSGEKIVFCHCQKNLWRFGVRPKVNGRFFAFPLTNQPKCCRRCSRVRKQRTEGPLEGPP